MSAGTEEFPNLGRHCSEETCHQLDFLPFTCDSCLKVFCLEHRSHKAHMCPKANQNDRSVIICPVCSATVKKTFGETSERTLAKHNEGGECSPALVTAKPRCPVKRCRQTLTFSNTYHCKSCMQDICLKHRYAADHTCTERRAGVFLEALAKRGATDCAASGVSESDGSRGDGPQRIERKLGSLRLGKAY